MWHLQVLCINYQHSVQQYTRCRISEIVKNVEEFIVELAARQYWYKTDGDNVKMLAACKYSNKRDTASLVAEIKKLKSSGKYKEVKSGSFVNGRNIYHFLQEEGKAKEEFIAAMRMEEP